MFEKYFYLLKALVLNEKCILCFNPIPFHNKAFPLCDSCMAILNKPENNICLKCSTELISEKNICLRCRSSNYFFKNNYSLFYYEDKIKDLIQYYKFNNIKSLGKYFAVRISQKLDLNSFIVPVPCNPENKHKRGWDPVEVIIKNLPVKKNKILKIIKRHKGINQKKLNKKERLNITNKYYLIKNTELPEKVILIDDIFTTGSTLNEICKLLLNNGVKEIKTLTIALDLCD